MPLWYSIEKAAGKAVAGLTKTGRLLADRVYNLNYKTVLHEIENAEHVVQDAKLGAKLNTEITASTLKADASAAQYNNRFTSKSSDYLTTLEENAERVNEIIKTIKHTLLDSELLAVNPKYVQLEADIAEMAAKVGIPPPKIMVTRLPLGSMAAPSEEIILVAESELEQATSRELKATAGHELGHISRGDHLTFDPSRHWDVQDLAAQKESWRQIK